MLQNLSFGSGKTFRGLSPIGKTLNWTLVAAEAVMMVRKPSVPRGMLLASSILTAVAYMLPAPGESK